MRYRELDTYWKRIFELEWSSLCEGSKAIAALIVSMMGKLYRKAEIRLVRLPFRTREFRMRKLRQFEI